jgi:hypothetical protein
LSASSGRTRLSAAVVRNPSSAASLAAQERTRRRRNRNGGARGRVDGREAGRTGRGGVGPESGYVEEAEGAAARAGRCCRMRRGPLRSSRLDLVALGRPIRCRRAFEKWQPAGVLDRSGRVLVRPPGPGGAWQALRSASPGLGSRFPTFAIPLAAPSRAPFSAVGILPRHLHCAAAFGLPVEIPGGRQQQQRFPRHVSA